jgi:hypothetical protein
MELQIAGPHCGVHAFELWLIRSGYMQFAAICAATEIATRAMDSVVVLLVRTYTSLS